MSHVCEQCGKVFNRKFCLNRHLKKIHGVSYVDENHKYYSCGMCTDKYPSIKEINFHYAEKHGLNLEIETLHFSTETDWKNWMKEMQKKTSSKYILKCGTTKETSRFVCHRTGNFKSVSKGERHIKTQGSKKINAICPSYVRVYKTEKNEYEVKFLKTHVGHEDELCHLTISPTKKEEIAKKLINKVPHSAILDDIRDSYDGETLERTHLVTTKDIHNISAEYGIALDFKRHSIDAVSVDALVEELKRSSNSCVVYYKKQEVLDSAYPFLLSQDFVLILMNRAQEKLFKKFGSEVIATDGTHGLGYDFQLYSVIVLDELHQGLPCSLLITNRSDTAIFEFYYGKIKEKVGILKPKIFMSDMAEELYTAWVSVMGEATSRLYCSWHVDRAWQKNLTKIKDKVKRDTAYKLIRTVMEELDENKFVLLLEDVVKTLTSDDDMKEYGQYFAQYYVKTAKHWAYCYRQHSSVNTNMHLERIHRTIKYLYWQGKVVNRLDKAIDGLLKYVRDRLFDRLIMLNKGKISTKLRTLRQRHKTAIQMGEKLQVTCDEANNTFIVTSEDNKVYYVQENCISCNCKLICLYCNNSCIHRYYCSCPDSMVTFNMCKHIHRVCLYIKNPNVSTRADLNEANTSSDQSNLNLNDLDVEPMIEPERNLEPTGTGDMIIHKESMDVVTTEELQESFLNLLELAKCRRSKQELLKMLKRCISTVTLLENDPKNVLKKVRPKISVKNISKQRLYSTKKKNTKLVRRKKPNSHEKEEILTYCIRA